jgi:membrane peptidoglycan carboxypeptidase
VADGAVKGPPILGGGGLRRRGFWLAIFATLAVYALAAWLLVLPEIVLPVSVPFASVAQDACRDRADWTQGDGVILWLPLADIPEAVVTAVLLQEDRAFWVHRGVDWDQVLRAFRRNVEAGGYRFGAGTITMQLMRELVLGKDRTLVRKVREVAYALQAERRLGKDEILEMYLNVVHWGRGVRGIGAAACHYFGLGPRELSSGDVERLVRVLPSPPRLGPQLRRDLRDRDGRSSERSREPVRARLATGPPCAAS